MTEVDEQDRGAVLAAVERALDVERVREFERDAIVAWLRHEAETCVSGSDLPDWYRGYRAALRGAADWIEMGRHRCEPPTSSG